MGEGLGHGLVGPVTVRLSMNQVQIRSFLRYDGRRRIHRDIRNKNNNNNNNNNNNYNDNNNNNNNVLLNFTIICNECLLINR